MSAMGQKRTFGDIAIYVRYWGLSGHRKGVDAESRIECPLSGVKRTLDVRLAPNSRHKWLWRGMSAYDPKRTLPQSVVPVVSISHFAGLGSQSSSKPSIARTRFLLNNYICLVVFQRRVSGQRAFLTDRHQTSTPHQCFRRCRRGMCSRPDA